MLADVSANITALGDRLEHLETAINQTMHEFLTTLRRFDAVRGWLADGAGSFAVWLVRRLGLGTGAARERIRVARALAELPAIDAALAAGELSYSKVRALTRVACPASEEVLLSRARAMTTARLEKLCAALRRGQARVDIDVEPHRPERSFRQRITGDGMVRLTIELTAEEAATVTRALDVSAETPDRRAEALVALAEKALRGDVSDRAPSEVVVNVDADALGDAAGTTDDGAVLSKETCRRLLCDAGIAPVLTQRGRTIHTGPKTRTIPGALRQAMVLRDGGCRFPGCDRQIVDGHHIVHWADGGQTKLDNIVSLCHAHHQLVHEGGATIVCVERDGAIGLHFYAADGSPLPRTAPIRPRHRPPLVADDIDPWLAVASDRYAERRAATARRRHRPNGGSRFW